MDNNYSAKGLVVISQLYNEGLITDDDREMLKDMIFQDDAILISLFERYDDHNDLKDAVLKYCKGGAIEANRPKGLEPSKDTSELDQISSPTDSALDLKKRKRLNQLAAAEKEKTS